MLSKTKLNFLILAFFLSASGCVTLQVAAPQQDSYQVFYDNLSPYGDWINNPDYGYVWAPNVQPGFTPYSTNGYWLSTDEGWSWVSNYSWGWATFHYGRWYYDSYYGWLWVPGNQWAPAWVAWRSTPEYYGWAPLGPGISVDYGYSDRYNVPTNNWRFVRNMDFGRIDMVNYYVSPSDNGTIIINSRVINNFKEDKTRNVRYNGGPDRNELEQRVGKKFEPVPVTDGIRPGENIGDGRYQIYKPLVQQNTAKGNQPAPSRVTNVKDLKPAAERTGDTRQQGIQPIRPQDLNNPHLSTPTKPRESNSKPNQNNQPVNIQPNTSPANNAQKQADPPVRPQRDQTDHRNQQPQNQSPTTQQPGVDKTNQQTQPINPPVKPQQKLNDQNNQSGHADNRVNQQPNQPQPNAQLPQKLEQIRQQQNARQNQQRLQTNTNQRSPIQTPAKPPQQTNPANQHSQTLHQPGNSSDHITKPNERKFDKNDSTRQKRE
jgi:hypothetical protein